MLSPDMIDDSPGLSGLYRTGPSHLQLYSFDVMTGIELEIKDMVFNESDQYLIN
jgi:hypothetical protein